MSDSTNTAVPIESSIEQQYHSNRLLQLPGPVLSQVLQQLDQCSLACTAVTCSTLRHAVLASISKLAVRCSTPETLESFNSWLEGHSSSSLDSLTQCSVVNAMQGNLHLCITPCPQLRQLRLEGFEVQLGPANGLPGLLCGCQGLTALDLQRCMVLEAAPAAAAAITALPGLRSLTVDCVHEARTPDCLNRDVVPQLQQCLQLTHLKMSSLRAPLGCVWPYDHPDDLQLINQSAGLTNLCHLDLGTLGTDWVPGGLLSKLVQLTCLVVRCADRYDKHTQFEHLRGLTALQQLSAESSMLVAEDLSGIQQLAQLTGLELTSYPALTGHPPSWSLALPAPALGPA